MRRDTLRVPLPDGGRTAEPRRAAQHRPREANLAVQQLRPMGLRFEGYRSAGEGSLGEACALSNYGHRLLRETYVHTYMVERTAQQLTTFSLFSLAWIIMGCRAVVHIPWWFLRGLPTTLGTSRPSLLVCAIDDAVDAAAVAQPYCPALNRPPHYVYLCTCLLQQLQSFLCGTFARVFVVLRMLQTAIAGGGSALISEGGVLVLRSGLLCGHVA